MKKLLITITVMALTMLLVFPSGTAAAGSDPASVARTLLRAYNAHNLDAVTALFADDAVFTVLPQGIVLTGKAQIRAALQQGAFAQNSSLRMVAYPQISGDKVTWSVQASNDAWRQLGIDRLLNTNEAIVRGGKITSVTVGLTPESVARLQAAMAATQSK